MFFKQSGVVKDTIWSSDLSQGAPVMEVAVGDLSETKKASTMILYTMRDVDVVYSLKADRSLVVGCLRAGCAFKFSRIAESGTFVKLSEIHYTHMQTNETCIAEKFLPHNLSQFGWCQIQSSDISSTPFLVPCDEKMLDEQYSTAEFLEKFDSKVYEAKPQSNNPNIELWRGSNSRNLPKANNPVALREGVFVTEVAISMQKVYFEIDINQFPEKWVKIFFCTLDFEKQPSFSDDFLRDDAFSWKIYAASADSAYQSDLPNPTMKEGATICIALDATKWPCEAQISCMSLKKSEAQTVTYTTVVLSNCFAPYLFPAFSGTGCEISVNFGLEPFKYKDQVATWKHDYMSICDCLHTESKKALSQPHDESLCDITLTKTKCKDFNWTNNSRSVKFPTYTSILFGSKSAGAHHPVTWWSFVAPKSSTWSCGLVPEKEVDNRYALWSRQGCVALSNDPAMFHAQQIQMSGFVIVVVEYLTKRAIFFDDGKVVACYVVPETEFPLRLGICGQNDITIDMPPASEAYVNSLRQSVIDTPNHVVSVQLPLKERSAVALSATSTDYKLLKRGDPGDIGVVAASDDTVEVRFEGKTHQYKKEDLQAVCNRAGFPVSCGKGDCSHIMYAALKLLPILCVLFSERSFSKSCFCFIIILL